MVIHQVTSNLPTLNRLLLILLQIASLLLLTAMAPSSSKQQWKKLLIKAAPMETPILMERHLKLLLREKSLNRRMKSSHVVSQC